MERALLLRALGRGLRGVAPAVRRRPGLVHHPRARLRRGPALGPPRLRPRQGLALVRLGGRPRRRREPRRRPRRRGLPLDPVLRLRCVPGAGDRDPDRSHRPRAPAAQRRLTVRSGSIGWMLTEVFAWRGRSVRWSRAGDGPPVVFCHGTPWSSELWRPLAEALAARHTVYLWDMPGY